MATIKISELNPLASGSVIGNNVIPIVSGGATNKISVDDLQGKLRGPSNSICATQSNSTCTQHVLGVQNKINACGVVSIIPNLDNPNTYDGTCVNSAYSSILGGVNNKIEGNFVNYLYNSTSYYCQNSTNLIAGGANSSICNNGTATNYDSAGGNSIIGAVMSRIEHFDCGYQPAHNTIIGGQRNTIGQFNTSGGNSYTRDNVIAGSYRSSITTGTSAYANLKWNRIIGSSYSFILSNASAFTSVDNNTIISGRCSAVCDAGGNVNRELSENHIFGGYYSRMVHSAPGNFVRFRRNAILGGDYNKINATSANTECNVVIGGQNAVIQNSLKSSIIGGCNNCIDGFNNSIIAGGDCITARASNALHVEKLLLETGSIPTSDPNIPGMLYIAGGALKVSGCL